MLQKNGIETGTAENGEDTAAAQEHSSDLNNSEDCKRSTLFPNGGQGFTSLLLNYDDPSELVNRRDIAR